jgi:hypothetical protein
MGEESFDGCLKFGWKPEDETRTQAMKQQLKNGGKVQPGP